MLSESFKLCGTSGLLIVVAFLKYLPGDKFGFKKLMTYWAHINKEQQDIVANTRLWTTAWQILFMPILPQKKENLKNIVVSMASVKFKNGLLQCND